MSTTRFGLRLTPEQKTLLRRAAEIEHKSLTAFILDNACRAAEEILLSPLLVVPEDKFQAFQNLLDRPEQPNEGLRRLFSRDERDDPVG